MKHFTPFLLILAVLFFSNLVYSEEGTPEQKRGLLVKELNFDKERGIVGYELTMPAWVRIRLGLKEGPMCKTLVDWEKRASGVHQEKWDGLDPSGTVRLAQEEDMVFTFNYFTAGNEYITAANVNDYMMPPENMIIGRTLPTLKLNQMHKNHPREFCHDPQLNVVLPKDILQTEKGIYIIEDKAPIEISIADVDKQWFSPERYSIHIFIDGVFAGGELEGYSPYKWIFDPEHLNQGEHLIMVNFAGFNDHFGIAAIPVYIKKKVD